ncbi:Hypothetical protein ACI5QN_03181 [Bacillus cereus]
MSVRFAKRILIKEHRIAPNQLNREFKQIEYRNHLLDVA